MNLHDHMYSTVEKSAEPTLSTFLKDKIIWITK